MAKQNDMFDVVNVEANRNLSYAIKSNLPQIYSAPRRKFNICIIKFNNCFNFNAASFRFNFKSIY